MIKIQIFTQRSVLIVLLVSNAINPLLALPIKSHSITKRNQESISIFQKIKEILVQKGLDNDIALEKNDEIIPSKTKYNNKITISLWEL